MKYTTLLLLVATFLPFRLSGQSLSGTYTIGGVSPDFNNTQGAVNALVQNGVSGPVVFNFRPGTYGGMVLLNAVQGLSAQNNVIFQAENADSTSVILSSGSLPLIRLRDQRYFTFQYLTIKPSSSSTQASAFWAEFCDEISINHCYFQYDGPTAGGSDHAAVKFTHRFDGGNTVCRLLNTTITGTAICFNTTGGKGHTIVSGCRLNSTGPYSLQSRYQGTLSLTDNVISQKVYISFCDAMYLQGNVLEEEADFGSVVKFAKGNRFLSVQSCDFNYVELLDSNYFACPVMMRAGVVSRNRFDGQVNMSHSNNTVFRQNRVENFASFGFCNYLTLQRNEFRDDMDLAFCDNSKVIANLFHRYCGIAICHTVQIMNNNFGPNVIFDFSSYTSHIVNNNFSREIEGDSRIYSGDNYISGNNYYPSGGTYDQKPFFIPPDYPDSTNLRPRNPLLIGKCTWISPTIGVDFDGRSRPSPATLGAYELCIHSGDTIEIPCGDAIRLSLCGIPASGKWQWTPEQGLDNPRGARPLAKPVSDTRYVLTDSLSGWSDTLWVHIVPYQADLPDTVSVLCGQSTFLTPRTHAGATFTWSPPDGLSSVHSANPVAAPTESITYFLEVAAPGCGIYTDSVYFEVDPLPRAFGTYDQNGNVIQFYNRSFCADSFLWGFGDGQTSTDFEPEHIYADTGLYPIFLIAMNDYGRDTIYGEIMVWFTVPVAEQPGQELLKVFPNPFSAVINLETPDEVAGPVELALFDMLGRLVWRGEDISGASMLRRFQMPGLSPGLYVGQFSVAGKILGQAKLLRTED